MAKRIKPPRNSPPPDRLTIRLFANGMSPLHRAGLGGLACSLKSLERQHENGLLPDEKLPGPLVNGQYPWEITSDTVTLVFGKPELAADYLKKLFAFAFQIRNGVIYLPGQYLDPPPSLPVLAAIQEGIQNTFLQHGPTCGSRDGQGLVTSDTGPVSHDVFTSYKHQGWFWLDRDERQKEKDPNTGKKLKTGRRQQQHKTFPAVLPDGTLSGALHMIDNKLSPGGTVRHDSYDESAIRETDSGLICLHFAIVGCLTLCINPVTAVLLVPEVGNLVEFLVIRGLLTPRTVLECQIAGAADAALQAHLRLRDYLPSFLAVTCQPTQWNAKQKPRVDMCDVSKPVDVVLNRFERALALLPAKLSMPKAKRSVRAKESHAFWSESVVRPMVAENLVRGRKWYAGFVNLMTKTDPATEKKIRDHISYERGGLNAMITDDQMWDTESERIVVQAVHEAIRSRYAKIAEENQTNFTAMRNRWNSETDRWRYAFAGAKTADQFRHAICDLFSRTRGITVLQSNWSTLLPMLRQSNWQHARDLALLGLCSYQPKGANKDDTDILETPSSE